MWSCFYSGTGGAGSLTRLFYGRRNVHCRRDASRPDARIPSLPALPPSRGWFCSAGETSARTFLQPGRSDVPFVRSLQSVCADRSELRSTRSSSARARDGALQLLLPDEASHRHPELLAASTKPRAVGECKRLRVRWFHRPARTRHAAAHPDDVRLLRSVEPPAERFEPEAVFSQIDFRYCPGKTKTGISEDAARLQQNQISAPAC